MQANITHPGLDRLSARRTSRTFVWRLGPLAVLLVITLLGGHALAADPAPNTEPIAGPTGIYVFYDWSNLSPTQYPIVGGHMVFLWDRIEAQPGIYDWSAVDDWLSKTAAQSKRVGIKIDTYEGQARGGTYIPGHVRAKTPQIIVTCPDGSVIPRYWDASYKQAFGDLVRAFGARYSNDARVAWVEISTGIFGETAPAEDRFDTCLQDAGLTGRTWIDYVNWTTDTYLAAFPAKQLLLQYAPRYLSPSERREFTDYAASLGVGLKHNGLSADPGGDAFFTDPAMSSYRAGQYDPIHQWSGKVAIGFEGSNIGTSMAGRANVLWSLYNALDKHADMLNLDTAVASNADNQDLLRFAARYLGRTPADTPSVWVALRETEYDWFPDYGNYEFWLYQNDAVPGGQTVPLWRVTSAPEGRYTRRTDQASGNPAMYFDVADRYTFGGPQTATIRVTYLDRGTDTWELQYDDGTETNHSAGIIAKTNTNQWVTIEFNLNAILLANRQPGGGQFPGSDFRITSRGDGDETIHRVEVIAHDRPTPMPTLTITPGLPPEELDPVLAQTPAATSTPMPTPTPTATPWYESPQVPQGNQPYCLQPPRDFVLDGGVSEWLARPSIQANRGAAPSAEGDGDRPRPAPDDLSAYVWCAWRSDGFMLAAEIMDDVLVRDSADSSQDDGLEFTFTRNESANTSEITGLKYTVLPDGSSSHPETSDSAGVTLAIRRLEGGWSVELHIPASLLAVNTLSAGEQFGFMFALNDDDDGGTRDSRVIWQGQITLSQT